MTKAKPRSGLAGQSLLFFRSMEHMPALQKVAEKKFKSKLCTLKMSQAHKTLTVGNCVSIA